MTVMNWNETWNNTELVC